MSQVATSCGTAESGNGNGMGDAEAAAANRWGRASDSDA